MSLKTGMLACVAIVMSVGAAPRPAPADLAGSWIGQIDTDRGQMEIGLVLREEKGKLTGTLKTAHGDWEITDVRERGGVWTVAFKAGDSPGAMTGRITDGRFSGEWKYAHAVGTFELKRTKKSG
jgi:hypothetical protein